MPCEVTIPIEMLAAWIEADMMERQEAINFEVYAFDELTRRGAKLNLITGQYEFPK